MRSRGADFFRPFHGWLRVRRHLVEGDFQSYGYFPGVEFQSDPPLVWLVAPSLRFHPATEGLARYLLPNLQMSRFGLRENWRRGVRVVFRQSFFFEVVSAKN
ncbi:MAG: hypothetical protein WBD73_17750 [Candidatus Acidiferrales bacterium]